MSRRSAFSFATFDIHLKPSMQRAFAPAERPVSAFELSLAEKLEALRRVLDDKSCRVQVATAA